MAVVHKKRESKTHGAQKCTDLGGTSLLLPNVRSQEIIPGRTNIRANSAAVRRASRKFVLINSGAAGQQRTFGMINSEAGGYSECIYADASIATCGHK